MKAFEFTGDITFDDFVQMNRQLTRESFLKIRISRIIIPFLFILIAFNVYNFIENGYIRFFEDVLPVLVFIPFWLLIWFYMINRPKFLFKKYYAENKINKIKYDNDTIYIFINGSTPLMIQKRYLNDENEYNELKTFLQTNYTNYVKY